MRRMIIPRSKNKHYINNNKNRNNVMVTLIKKVVVIMIKMTANIKIKIETPLK